MSKFELITFPPQIASSFCIPDLSHWHYDPPSDSSKAKPMNYLQKSLFSPS